MSYLSLSFSMSNTYMIITGNTSFLLKHAFGTLQGKCQAVMGTVGLFHIPETLSLHCFQSTTLSLFSSSATGCSFSYSWSLHFGVSQDSVLRILLSVFLKPWLHVIITWRALKKVHGVVPLEQLSWHLWGLSYHQPLPGCPVQPELRTTDLYSFPRSAVPRPQLQLQLGTCRKRQFSSSTPNLLTQKLGVGSGHLCLHKPSR